MACNACRRRSIAMTAPFRSILCASHFAFFLVAGAPFALIGSWGEVRAARGLPVDDDQQQG
jgi:hypothetical protein